MYRRKLKRKFLKSLKYTIQRF